jgi:hypothetical protein
MYFVSAALALCVAVFCTFFSFASGSGWPFLLPTSISVLALFAVRASPSEIP